MLEVVDIDVRFDRHPVLDALSLQVSDGEVVAVLGPSGAGKSTLLRVIAGLLRPDAGAVCSMGSTSPHGRHIFATSG